MRGSTLKISASAILLASAISFSKTPTINLGNVNSTLNFRREHGKIEYEEPKIREFSQIEDMTRKLYAKLTGQEALPGIRFVSRRGMRKTVRRTINLNQDQDYPELYSRTENLLYVRQDRFRYSFTCLAHGLGHYSTESRAEGKGLDGLIVEEAKAISFSGAWSEELKNHLFLSENGNKVAKVGIGKIKHSGASPVHYLAYQIVEDLKRETGTYKQAYETITTTSDQELLKHVESNPIYKDLKAGRISSTAYKDF
jgi:hypothetical protein